jgi:hypothetical protein
MKSLHPGQRPPGVGPRQLEVIVPSRSFWRRFLRALLAALAATPA